MLKHTILRLNVAALSVGFSFSLFAQGTFQNLDFESASLSPTPPGQYGGPVSITAALPGWTGYLGTTQISSVQQNNFALGDASIDVVGPAPAWGVIEGSYSVDLQAGANPLNAPLSYETASISQTGLVPADAQSLEFKAVSFGPPTVSIGEDSLTLFPLGSGPAAWGSGYNYTLYGVSVAPFAGKVETLTITESYGGNNFFDSFSFSPSTVPEPSTFALTGLGALIFGLCRRFNVRSWRRR